MEQDLSQKIFRMGEIIENRKMGAIILPPNPSIDSIAAATSLYLSLIKKGLTICLVCPTVIEEDIFGVEKFQTSPQAPGDSLVISFPYVEGSIDKIDSFIEDDKFSLIITPRPGFKKLDPNQVSFSYTGGNFDFIIIINTPSLNSLGEFYKNNPSLFQGKEIINIDRHFGNANYGTLNIIKKDAASISELIFQIIKNLQLEIDKDIATNLYYGIAAGTNNFTSYSTTADTFQTIAELLRAGAMKKNFKKSPAPQSAFENIIKRSSTQSLENQKSLPVEKVEKEKLPEEKNTPSDWLKPKIFRSGGGII